MNRKIVSTLVALCLFVSLQGQAILHTNPVATVVAEAGGGELLSGGDFADSNCWSVSGDYSISGGVLNYAGAAASNCVQVVCGTANVDVTILESDTDYVLQFDVVSDAPGLYISVWSVNSGGTLTDGLVGGVNRTTGHITIEFNSGTLTEGANGFCLCCWGDAAGTVDDISLTVDS